MAYNRYILFQSLKLLSVLAAIRLDEDTDSIRDTLVLTLVEPKKGTSRSTTDPLASSTWEEVLGNIVAFIYFFVNESNYFVICYLFMFRFQLQRHS